MRYRRIGRALILFSVLVTGSKAECDATDPPTTDTMTFTGTDKCAPYTNSLGPAMLAGSSYDIALFYFGGQSWGPCKTKVQTLTTIYNELTHAEKAMTLFVAVGKEEYQTDNAEFCKGAFGSVIGDQLWTDWEVPGNGYVVIMKKGTDAWEPHCGFTMTDEGTETKTALQDLRSSMPVPTLETCDDPELTDMTFEATDKCAPFADQLGPTMLAGSNDDVAIFYFGGQSWGPCKTKVQTLTDIFNYNLNDAQRGRTAIVAVGKLEYEADNAEFCKGAFGTVVGDDLWTAWEISGNGYVVFMKRTATGWVSSCSMAMTDAGVQVKLRLMALLDETKDLAAAAVPTTVAPAGGDATTVAAGGDATTVAAGEATTVAASDDATTVAAGGDATTVAAGEATTAAPDTETSAAGNAVALLPMLALLVRMAM